MGPIDKGASRRSAARISLSVAAVLAVGIGLAVGVASRHSTTSGQLGVETPSLEGPDPVDLAPLIAVTTTGLAFDHEPIDGAGLESRLRAYTANFPILHPGEPAPKEFLLACSPAIPSQRVFAAIETAHRLGFHRASLVFETAHPHTPAISAAQLSIVDADAASPDPGARRIRPSDVQNCAQLSERVVALRRAGLRVTLVAD